MDKISRTNLKPLSIAYVWLGIASSLSFLRLTLRLLAADELSPVGRLLVELGGFTAAPFGAIIKTVIGQKPGSIFEAGSLAAGLGYLLLAGLLAGLAGMANRSTSQVNVGR